MSIQTVNQHSKVAFSSDSRGMWHEVMLFLVGGALQTETLHCPRWPVYTSKSNPKLVILHNTVLARSPAPHSPPSLFLSLSVLDQSPASESRVGEVCSCWRTHPTGRQPDVWALQRRPQFVLWPAASPQWVCVCVCVCHWVCLYGGSWQSIPSRVLNSSWRVSEPHSHVKMHTLYFFMKFRFQVAPQKEVRGWKSEVKACKQLWGS